MVNNGQVRFRAQRVNSFRFYVGANAEEEKRFQFCQKQIRDQSWRNSKGKKNFINYPIPGVTSAAFYYPLPPSVIKLALSSTRSSLFFFNLLSITRAATQPGNFKTNISSGSFRNFRSCRRLLGARVAQFLRGTLMKRVLPARREIFDVGDRSGGV